uniref:Uncharacterized protein AlNc14C2G276 n=1 Tax=Albugo laibachii Nc14 TaxID=890382 RepID=F0VZD8_9STRA|nr:conserved hypothetical protein [Albugo laibachii Nc14]|eukprot:CCA14168.1 conserved hypothetical protein [Albugo laibachii Nc14]
MTMTQQQHSARKLSPTSGASDIFSYHDASLSQVASPRSKLYTLSEKQRLQHVFLEKPWEIHFTSPLFHFDSRHLRQYVRDLIIHLRTLSVAAFHQEFGYQVQVYPFMSDTLFLFEVCEERAGTQNTIGPLEKKASKIGEEIIVHGSFMLYFPSKTSSTYVQATSLEELRRSMDSQHSKSSASSATTTNKKKKRKEPQHVIFMSGEESLLIRCCGWLQQQFQCVVGQQTAQLGYSHLRLLSNLLIFSCIQTMTPQQRRSTTGPFLLKYQSLNGTSNTKSYTMTIPFANAARLYSQESSKHVDEAPSITDVLTMIENLYFQQLPLNTSEFKLHELQMDAGSISSHGLLKIHLHEMIEPILNGILAMLEIYPVSSATQQALRL